MKQKLVLTLMAIFAIGMVKAAPHAYVDLGLPSGTLWATCNVGATVPEGYGDYFAWGETKPQASKAYDWSSYKWCNGSEKTHTKYCKASRYGTVDDKTILDPVDDAATANWGANWCMPTHAQQAELVDSSYTTSIWTTLNGVFGYKITSKANGNSIFLPAAGNYKDGSLQEDCSYGYYWSSELATTKTYNDSRGAYQLSFKSTTISARNYYFRRYGRPVRAVRSASK